MSTRYVGLGEVASFVRGISFKPQDVGRVDSLGAVACMRTSNVQSELDLSDVWGVADSLVKRADQYLRHGDILVSSANSWNLVGKCCWIPELPWHATFGGFVSVLRADPAKVDPRFLFRWFASTRIQATVRSFGQRTTSISNLNLERCLDLPFPLLPLPAQRRIAEVLDRAEALRVKRRFALAQLNDLKLRFFDDLFEEFLGGPAVDSSPARSGLPTGWSWQRLTSVARMATGHTPDRERDDYWNGDIPWISLTDIRELDGAVATRTSQSVTALGISHSSSVRLPPGTVCVSRTASVGFVTVMGPEMATSQDFVNWVCGPTLEPLYLMWAFVSSRRRLRALSTGSTHKTIYMRVFEQLHVLVPPVTLQREFAQRIAVIDSISADQRSALAQLNTLFASLQARAFQGEL